MRSEELVTVLRATPFRPFRIHLADGRHLTVEHPEFLMRSPSGRSAILYNKNDTFEVIDLLLVSTLEVLNGSRRNGRKGSR
jgi:hypothetical protein